MMARTFSTAREEIATIAEAASDRSSLRLAVFEVVWIFLIFFLYSGSLPPDAGESHYLVKAKHYWNPAWCAGDQFLESYDTHLGFYWTLGWLTRWFSLDASAWIIRVVVWSLLAVAWRRLSWAIVPKPLFSLLSVGLMLVAAEHFHWSKEIVLRGGVEGKTIAYVGVLLTLEAVARNRWSAALLWIGAASAFHVLVGGWTAIALALAWAFSGRQRPPLRSLIIAAAAGFVLALPGLIPALALRGDAAPQDSAEAARIYVFERLSHHLVFHRFPVLYQLRHGLLIGLWIWLAWLSRADMRLTRVGRVVAGTVVIAMVGITIDQFFVVRANLLAQLAEEYEQAAASLLRYYWFRVEDALVPVGIALAATLTLARLRAKQLALGEWVTAAAVLVATANIANACYWRARLRVPGAVLQQLATDDTRLTWWWEKASSPEPESSNHADRALLHLSARERYDWWLAACRWIEENTLASSRVLTPRRQQTFKWNAGRAEVATRKDIPQDPAGILVWHEALHEIYPNDLPHRQYDLAAFSDAELIRLARKYSCQYILVERRWQARRVGLPRLYPRRPEMNPVFEVFHVPPPGSSPESQR